MPTNDNWASAATITGASGSTTGTTTGAGVETSEPQHYNYNPPVYPVARALIDSYATVWYTWTCPAGGTYLFTTRDKTGALATNYKSTLQIFTGSSLAALLRVALIIDQGVGDGDGTDNGASVVFQASASTVYYIQIDGRGTGVTGNFKLAWGLYDACVNANFNLNTAFECLAVSQLTMLRQSTTINCPGPSAACPSFWSFGSQPAMPGKYAVRMVAGTVIAGDDHSTSPWAVVLDGDASGLGLWDFSHTFTAGSWAVEIASGDLWIGKALMTADAAHAPDTYCGTYWACPNFIGVPATLCDVVEILHPATGAIGIVSDPDSATWVDGPQNPTYQLVYYPLTIGTLTNETGFAISGSGTSWNITFQIHNHSDRVWENTTIELLSTGGVSSPSAAQVITLAASGVTDTGTAHGSAFTMTADPTAGLVTATIKISRNVIVVGTIDYPLYPIFVVTLSGLNLAETTCTGYKIWSQKVTVTALWPPNSIGDFGGYGAGFDFCTSFPAKNSASAILSLTGGSPPNLYGSWSCGSPVANATAYSSVGCYTAPTDFDFSIQGGASAQSVTIQVALGFKTSSGSPIALPTFTQTITVPPA